MKNHLSSRFGSRFATFAFVVVLLNFVSCATPPTDEMNAAEEAVTRAENTPEVPRYAANTLARAKEALTNMKTEADAKRYDSAKNFAQEAVQAAEKAISDAKSQAVRARDDANTALNALRAAISETENAITQGKKNSKLKLNWPQLDNDFDAAKSIAAEAESAASAQRYSDVVERSSTARTALGTITAQISQASLALTRKK
jgi:hypothetical protein